MVEHSIKNMFYMTMDSSVSSNRRYASLAERNFLEFQTCSSVYMYKLLKFVCFLKMQENSGFLKN